MAGMVRAGVSDKAVGQASDKDSVVDGSSRHTSDLATGSGVQGKVRVGVLGVDGHEEFSAAGESGSQAESCMGERIST